MGKKRLNVLYTITKQKKTKSYKRRILVFFIGKSRPSKSGTDKQVLFIEIGSQNYLEHYILRSLIDLFIQLKFSLTR